MDIASEFLVVPSMPADREINRRLDILRNALANRDRSGLTGSQQDLFNRIEQAREKLERAAPISSKSELLTLAQFGAGSIGSMIADICNEDDVNCLQSVFIARFLTDVVMMSDRYGFLLPDDLLRRAGLDRGNLTWPESQPVFGDILSRAADTIGRADFGTKAIKSRALRALIFTERQRVLKRVRRLRGVNPAGRRIDLNWFDRVSMRLRFRLH